MDGFYYKKEGWKFTDETKRHLTHCDLNDPDIDRMIIGFDYCEITIKREDYNNDVRSMAYRLETIERMMQRSFMRGQNYQASVIRGALNPSLRA